MPLRKEWIHYLTDNFMKSIVEKTAIITGSGMAGIVRALLLKRKFEKVSLIEKKSDLGGLLYSYKTDGGEFDYGTHFLRDTGVSELDEILFGDMNPEKWLTLGN